MTRWARGRSRVNTPADRPNSRVVGARDRFFLAVEAQHATSPGQRSPRARSASSSVTLVKMVGSTKKPFSNPAAQGTPPPQCRRRALGACRCRYSPAPSRAGVLLISGPIWVSGSSGSPMLICLGALGQAVDEAVVEALLHEDARAVRAAPGRSNRNCRAWRRRPRSRYRRRRRR